jgi:hypothetical protein
MGTEHEIQHFAWLNTLEFALWIGFPVALLVLVGAILGIAHSRSARHWRARVSLFFGAPAPQACLSGPHPRKEEGFERDLTPSAGTRSARELLFATATALTIVVLAYLGRTKAESARLWLFLAQPMCLAAGLTLHRLFGEQSRFALAIVWLAQFVIVLDIKRFQDFH